MKIAMIGHKRVPSREGGVEVVVEELGTRMVMLNHEVHAYNRKGKHVSGENYEVQNLKEYKGMKILPVLTIDKKGLAALSSSVFATIKAVLGRYDVIHFHAEGPCAMLWLPHLLGIRTVATIHGLDHQRSKWSNFAKKYILFGEKVAVKYADHIVVLSKNVQNYFKDTYNRETVFIPNGIEKPEYRESRIITENWNIKKDEYILFLGRIVPEKGIMDLVDAFKLVESDKKLVIAGGSSDTDEFMKELQEKASGDERIIFTGFVQGEALEELYSNAYIYTLPSTLEGMPISLLEAMSYKNCCLTSDIKECTEVIQDTGVSFSISNMNDLKNKLQMLCDSPETVDKYRIKAFNRAINEFNWDEVVDNTLKLYNK
ncbi:glycosyltransferase family 4 protein [Romboutsia sp.]|uniref:glycosyltransferase family 4 protein n=1 Tax=Romboutsia sp. TaxID=1965302 RepID=UPI003F387959